MRIPILFHSPWLALRCVRNSLALKPNKGRKLKAEELSNKQCQNLSTHRGTLVVVRRWRIEKVLKEIRHDK